MKGFIGDVWEVSKQNSMARTHVLVIINVRPCLEMQGLLLGVEGSGFVRWVSFMYTVVMCMVVLAVPLFVVGVWPMAYRLRQYVEYYYYNTLPEDYTTTTINTIVCSR